MEWKPATIEEVLQILQSNLAKCNCDQVNAFEMYRVEPYVASIARLGNVDHEVAVAKRTNQVIYWEDVEEGFGVSPIDKNGTILEQDCNKNDLGLALNA